MKTKKKTEAEQEFSLEFLDDLIGEYYRAILEQIKEKPASLKMGELLKMLELRIKCTPDSNAQQQFWDMIAGIRKEQQSSSKTIQKKRKSKSDKKESRG